MSYKLLNGLKLRELEKLCKKSKKIVLRRATDVSVAVICHHCLSTDLKEMAPEHLNGLAFSL